MKDSIVSLLRCPLTMEKLTLEVYEREEKTYGNIKESEVKSGLLTSPGGYLFPIVKGIPRCKQATARATPPIPPPIMATCG